MKLGYLRDCLSPIALAHPIRSIRNDAVGTISQELTVHIVSPRRCIFSAMALYTHTHHTHTN